MAIVEAASFVAVELLRQRLSSDILPGNCQAEGESGLAIVVAGAAEADELGRERIESREQHRLGVQILDGLPERRSVALDLSGRRELARIEEAGRSQFGAVQSIAFKGVGPVGADIYLVKADKGSWEYRIWLSPDGKVEQANTRAVQ